MLSDDLAWVGQKEANLTYEETNSRARSSLSGRQVEPVNAGSLKAKGLDDCRHPALL
jgi:hypothetical protein